MISGQRKSPLIVPHTEKFLRLGRNTPTPITTPVPSDPRLSPRVMVDVDLSFVRPQNVDTATVVNHYLRSRTPTPASLLSDSDTSRDGDGAVAWTGKESHIKQAQLNAYVAWVNSQLKKRQGIRLVEDLRVDMRDGVALLHLIDIVGGEKLSGTHPDPSGYGEMKENVEKVLQFMCKSRIRMHHTNAADIVDGNLKAIMRLILALAAHYKPNSVKHSAYQHYRSPSKGNLAGIAQGASAALADARRHAARAGHRYRRSRDAAFNERRYQESSSDQFSESDECYRPTSRSRARHSRRDVEGSSSSPTTSIYGSPRSSANLDKLKASSRDSLISRSKSTDYVTAKDSGAEFEDTMTMIDKTQYEELLNEYSELATAMKETRQELSKLQDLLLSGKAPECENEKQEDTFEGSTPQEKIAVLRSRLLQQSELCEDLRSELSKSKNECMQLQGTRSGLQHRLCEQNISLSALKSELLQKDFQKQNMEAEKASLLKQLQERDKLISDIKKDIQKRDNKIDTLQHDLLLQIQEKESTTRSLKSQILDLHNKLKVVGETGATLSARVATQDKRMAKLEGKIFHPHPENGSPTSRSSGPDELQTVRESLQNLRLQYQPTDPQYKSVDNLEHSIASLLEHLYSFSNCATPVNRSSVNSVESSPKRMNYDKASDVRRSSNSSATGNKSSGFTVNQLDGLPTGQVCTKVLYFTDKMVTPFMCTIYKRLGEITLKDFKELFEKPNQFRYHFKALDPEYGTVKEEISNDDTIIPGWEGKIVAWIEEEQSTAC
ncbi:dixin-like isoform X2 [Haliotis asinina]|uniref:dixin-like isoform X2 n=1 Tax=Haliotis asinina TaxID=109174 RepID=UPI0035318827